MLPQDTFGPYHVVRTEHLKKYLAGEHAPDHIVGEVDEPVPYVHGDLAWTSETSFRYTVTICDESFSRTAELTAPSEEAALEFAPCK